MSLGVVVGSGRCIDVPGFPETLCFMLQELNFERMPEYTVHLRDGEFGKEHVVEVLVHARVAENNNRPYRFIGCEMNKEIAIQEAACVAIKRLRHDLPDMAATSFRLLPAQSSNGEVFYNNDFRQGDNPFVMAMAQLVESKEQERLTLLDELRETRRLLKAVEGLISDTYNMNIARVSGAGPGSVPAQQYEHEGPTPPSEQDPSGL